MEPIPVCVFAKPCVPGQVKTRLVPFLGPEGAAALARALFRDVWLAVSSCPGVRPILATVELEHCDEAHAFPPQISACDIWPQGDGDLGSRVEHIFHRALSIAPAAMAVGADSPLLTGAHIQDALRALETHDAVIGPCHDGGFYLLALRFCPPGLLSNLPWSTAHTAAATKQRLEEHGFSVHALEPLLDIDTFDDLTKLAYTVARNPSAAPATYAWHLENAGLLTP